MLVMMARVSIQDSDPACELSLDRATGRSSTTAASYGIGDVSQCKASDTCHNVRHRTRVTMQGIGHVSNVRKAALQVSDGLRAKSLLR